VRVFDALLSWTWCDLGISTNSCALSSEVTSPARKCALIRAATFISAYILGYVFQVGSSAWSIGSVTPR